MALTEQNSIAVTISYGRLRLRSTPSLVKGAASRDLSAIVVSGARMLNGKYCGGEIGSGTALSQFDAELKTGRMSLSDFTEVELLIDLTRQFFRHVLLLLAETGNSQTNAASGAKIDRRPLAVANSGRRTGCNDVSRFQAHEAAEIADEEGHSEDHSVC